MTRYFKYIFCLIFLAGMMSSCVKQKFQMGDLNAPFDVVINTTLVGQDAAHPDGDGSGDVEIQLSGKNVLAYYIDYNAADGVSPEFLTTSQITKKYTSVGLNKYRITVIAYGKGATVTTVTKDIQVRSDFTPDAEIVDNLVGTGSKTWKVNKDIAAHFGVGPWLHDANNGASDWLTPFWYSAPPNDKAGCCNCFYTASFTFAKVAASGTFTLTVATPDGAFTKTGSLAGGLPGIPASGGEQCYSYGGGTSSFTFVPSSSGISASTPSTKTAILLGGNNTFIGYGAVQKEYEILAISATSLSLRVRGTETGNAWYLILKAD
jgi:hypothetical protein